MNQNELKMLIALQPMIKKAMGEWQHGDMYCYIDTTDVDFYCKDCLYYNIFSIGLYKDAIRIPLTIDPVNPERGLIGTIEGFVKIHYNPYLKQWVVDVYDGFMLKKYSVIADTPTEAILKALCEQWEVKV